MERERERERERGVLSSKVRHLHLYRFPSRFTEILKMRRIYHPIRISAHMSFRLQNRFYLIEPCAIVSSGITSVMTTRAIKTAVSFCRLQLKIQTGLVRVLCGLVTSQTRLISFCKLLSLRPLTINALGSHLRKIKRDLSSTQLK